MAQRNIYSSRYRADRTFMRKLIALDPRLGCRYRLDLERFVITWEMPYGPPSELFVVKGDFGEFRHPDQRDMNFLCEGDLHRTDLREKLNKTERYMRNFREKMDRDAREELRDCTKDDKIQLRNAYRKVYNTGGKPAEFRRIQHKPKGKSLDELRNAVNINERKPENTQSIPA